MTCKFCGSTIDDNLVECPYCGHKTGKAAPADPVAEMTEKFSAEELKDSKQETSAPRCLYRVRDGMQPRLPGRDLCHLRGGLWSCKSRSDHAAVYFLRTQDSAQLHPWKMRMRRRSGVLRQPFAFGILPGMRAPRNGSKADLYPKAALSG